MVNQPTNNLSIDQLSAILREQHDAFAAWNLGVERSILSEVKKALGSPQIVVITGLRRVGKSTLLAQLAHTHLADDYYFVNFEDERLINFSAAQFDLLHEALISLFGEKSTFLFDEIQNVPEWERFVRRLHDQGFKFVITGSNASLLSPELGTKLTGRSLRYELFPFSFNEYVDFNEMEGAENTPLTTRERGRLLKRSQEYIASGGIPDALKYPELDIHKTLYDDVIYRDIAARYGIENVKSLQELAFYLVSNTATKISFNKLKGSLKLGSVNTVKKYINFLENAWLFFTINKYAYSVKEQQIAAKKIYGIDTGLINSVGFSFSENKGELLENLVFLQLRRNHTDIYYYKTDRNHEVDFFIPSQNLALQVCPDLSDESTKEREVRSLVELAEEQGNNPLLQVITLRDKDKIQVQGTTINVLPLYEWLLKP